MSYELEEREKREKKKVEELKDYSEGAPTGKIENGPTFALLNFGLASNEE